MPVRFAFHRVALPPFSALPFLLAALPAAAQQATLPPVTVVAPAETAGALASGSARSPLDVPFAVSSTATDTVRAQGGLTLQDALRNVPGAQADSGFAGAHTQFFVLRGAIADSGTGSNRVLRDGVRVSQYPYVPAFVERVDVLRGPGAALGVRAEPGGTVNLVSRHPSARGDFGSAYAQAGSHNQHELALDINRVLSEADGLALRAIATQSHASTWRHVPDRLDGAKLALGQQAGTRFAWRVGVEATRQRYQPDYGIPSAQGRPAAVPRDRQFGEPFGDSATDNRTADAHVDWALGDATRLQADLLRLRADASAIRNLLNGNPLPGQPADTYARATVWEPGGDRAIDSQALRLTHRAATGASAHHLVLGIERYREALQQPSLAVSAATSPPIHIQQPVYGRVTAPAAGAVLPRTLTTQDLRAEALSVQDQIDWGDWSAVLGLRHDRQRFVYGTAGVQPVDERRWSPKLGLLRRLDADHTVYANAATGTAPNQVASSSNRSLPSRRSAQVEAGWKAQWRGGALTSELALWRLRQANLIASDASTPAPFDFTVDGRARSQGLEASAQGALTDRLDVQFAYAFTDARYDDHPVHSNRRVPNVARQALNAQAQWRWDGGSQTGIGLFLQGARSAELGGATVLPGYGRVDLSQAWRMRLDGGRSLELRLAVRNLFDQRYFVSSHVHTARWVMPGQGRHAQLSAHYAF